MPILPKPFQQKFLSTASLPVWGLLGGLLVLLSLGLIALFQPLWLEMLLGLSETGFRDFLTQQGPGLPFPALLGLAFVGGVLGSISPCILALMPLNLGYMGTLQIQSRGDALRKAGAFVLGVVLINSLLGLVSGLGRFVMVIYRGWFLLAVALLVLTMAAAMLEWIRLPLPQLIQRMPNTGPFGVGMAFALISSPCASPVLFGVMALAATAKSTLLAVATMAVYGLGYTLLLFLASFFTGLSKQLGMLKSRGEMINRISAALLFLAGLWSLWDGLRWFFL